MRGRVRGGWFEVEQLRGFERFRVRVQAQVINGDIRATALHLDPLDPDAAQGLTSKRLATLPLQELANFAMRAGDFRRQSDLDRDLARLRGVRQTGGPRDPRRRTSPEAVAEVWLLAYHRGEPPRQAVCDALGISPRSADNYIREAVAQGLIPEAYRRRRGRRTDRRDK